MSPGRTSPPQSRLWQAIGRLSAGRTGLSPDRAHFGREQRSGLDHGLFAANIAANNP